MRQAEIIWQQIKQSIKCQATKTPIERKATRRGAQKSWPVFAHLLSQLVVPIGSMQVGVRFAPHTTSARRIVPIDSVRFDTLLSCHLIIGLQQDSPRSVGQPIGRPELQVRRAPDARESKVGMSRKSSSGGQLQIKYRRQRERLCSSRSRAFRLAGLVWPRSFARSSVRRKLNSRPSPSAGSQVAAARRPPTTDDDVYCQTLCAKRRGPRGAGRTEAAECLTRMAILHTQRARESCSSP